MTWAPYIALQFLWSSGNALTDYNFILYAATVIPLQGVWNCFNYARTRQLQHARELFSNMISNIGASFARQLSDAGRLTEQETRLTTIGAATTVAPPLSAEAAMDLRSYPNISRMHFDLNLYLLSITIIIPRLTASLRKLFLSVFVSIVEGIPSLTQLLWKFKVGMAGT